MRPHCALGDGRQMCWDSAEVPLPPPVLCPQQTFATTSLPLAGSPGHGGSGVLPSWLVGRQPSWREPRAGSPPGRRKASLRGCLRGPGPREPHHCSLLPPHRPRRYTHLTPVHSQRTRAPQMRLPHRGRSPRSGSLAAPREPPPGKGTVPASLAATSLTPLAQLPLVCRWRVSCSLAIFILSPPFFNGCLFPPSRENP